jgi:hypothetical protein
VSPATGQNNTGPDAVAADRWAHLRALKLTRRCARLRFAAPLADWSQRSVGVAERLQRDLTTELE